MILGLGNDIISIKRIEEAIEKRGQRFLDRIFTQTEQEYCLKHKESSRNFSGRFAAKEAAAKAIGTGLGQTVNWLDIEIINDASGKPNVKLSQKLADTLGNVEFLISISHCKEYAIATAIMQVREA